MPQHIPILRELLGPRFPDSGWMTGKQIFALAMSRAIGTRYKRGEASVGIRNNLFDVLLIQSGKRGISIDRQKAKELIDLISVEEQSLFLSIPDGWDKKIDCLLENQYYNRCGILIEIEHDLIECNARILKEVMES
jgi:hypothetical protein